MKQYTKYSITLNEDNGCQSITNVFCNPNIYNNTNNQGEIKVMSVVDNKDSILVQRDKGVFLLRVNNEEICFDEKLWFKVVETMLRLNLEMLNSNNK